MYKKSIFLVLSLIFVNSLSPQLFTRSKSLNTITPQQACCAKKLMWGSLCTLSCSFGGFWGGWGIMQGIDWYTFKKDFNDSTFSIGQRHLWFLEPYKKSRLKCLLFSAFSLACIASGLYSGNKFIKTFSR